MNKLKNLKVISQLQRFPISQSSAFVVILMATHLVNLIFNLYLGKSLDAKDFGVVTFITSLLYFTNIIFLSLVATISYTVAYLQTQNSNNAIAFFQLTRKKGIIFAIVASLLWLLLIPELNPFFQMQSPLPLLLYIPIFTLGIIAAANRGLLQGRLEFIKAGVILVSDAISKLFIAIIVIALGYKALAYVAIPFSAVFASLISLLLTKNVEKSTKGDKSTPFPIRFFLITSLAGLSTMAFLSLDIILVKHFFSPIVAGQYALLALTGKTIYFLGSLFNNFLIPLVGRDLGNGKNPIKTFNTIFSLTGVAVLLGFLTFGLFGYITAPMLFGHKASAITSLLLPYSLAIAGYTIATSITTYHLAKKEYVFPLLAIVNASLVAIGLIMLNDTLEQVVQVILTGSVINFISMIALHVIFTYFTNIKTIVFKKYDGLMSKSKAFLPVYEK